MPAYQYKLRDVTMEHSPAKNELGILVDGSRRARKAESGLLGAGAFPVLTPLGDCRLSLLSPSVRLKDRQ